MNVQNAEREEKGREDWFCVSVSDERRGIDTVASVRPAKECLWLAHNARSGEDFERGGNNDEGVCLCV